MVAEYTIQSHAVQYSRTEMKAAAERYVARGDELIGESLSLLRALHRQEHVTCRAEARHAFMEASHEHAEINRIGLLDANGNVMCTEPARAKNMTGLLPRHQADAPAVSLGLLEGRSLGAHAAIVGWHVGDGVRLVAYLDPEAIHLDIGPEFLRPYRRVSVTLGSSDRWFVMGQLEDNSDQPSDIVTEIAQSDRYPIMAEISVPASAVLKLVESLEFLVNIAAGLFGTLFVLMAIWMNRRPEVDDEFALAIRNSEFFPYYQPVMDLATGQLRGCEVLVRWIRKDGTVVPPGMFMHYAENSGHIFEITKQLMEKTVAEVGKLYADHPSFKLSVNLFAGHFDDREIVDDVQHIYGDGPISYHQLVFEVTERQPLRDIDKARRIMAELRSLGAKVALDDAGTGHGGLAYLQQLGIDIIKIDKMFIDALGSDHSSTTIVDTLVELAGNLGMGIIAEGVETMEQIEKLREMGVTTAQGYIFAPPLPGKLYIELANALAHTEAEAASELDDSMRPINNGIPAESAA